MKKLTIAVLLMFSVSSIIMAQLPIDKVIKFDKDVFSFGKIKQNKPVTHEFKFTNPGTKPLVIESAVAECGCTTPVFPTRPIMPGKSGTIKVTYDAKTIGIFSKKVTIKIVNEKESKIVTITGEVKQ